MNGFAMYLHRFLPFKEKLIELSNQQKSGLVTWKDSLKRKELIKRYTEGPVVLVYLHNLNRLCFFGPDYARTCPVNPELSVYHNIPMEFNQILASSKVRRHFFSWEEKEFIQKAYDIAVRDILQEEEQKCQKGKRSDCKMDLWIPSGDSSWDAAFDNFRLFGDLTTEEDIKAMMENINSDEPFKIIGRDGNSHTFFLDDEAYDDCDRTIHEYFLTESCGNNAEEQGEEEYRHLIVTRTKESLYAKVKSLIFQNYIVSDNR